MRKPARFALAAILLAVGGGLLGFPAQQKKEPLPKVLSALAPLYPRIAAAARIQGVVTLRVSTDGKHVVAFDAESGPALLVQTTKGNIKTWEFEQHKPTSFEIKFRYRLTNYHCDSGCNCTSDEKESVLLQLPDSVELIATTQMECDPAVTTEKQK